MAGRVLLFLMAVWSALGSETAGAQGPPQAGSGSPDPSLQAEMVAGLDGFYRIGKCTPVKVRLANRGPDVSGEVVVRLGRSSFAREVSLPSPSLKTVSFYVVPTKDIHELQAGFSTGPRRSVSFRAPARRLGDEELLAVISATLKAVLPAAEASPNARERRVFLSPADLPDEWREYDAVDTVTLEASDTARLRQTQRVALSRWTQLGGSVTIIDREKPATQTAGADMRSRGTASAPGRRSLFGLGSFGMVTGQPGENPAATGRASLLDIDQEVFESSRIREPLSRGHIFRYVTGFFAVYAASVVIWLHAGRSGRATLWRVPLIPAIALLFSVAGLGMGRLVDGGKTQIRQRSLIHIFPNSQDAFATSELTVLSSRHGTSTFSSAIASAYLAQADSEDAGYGCRYEFPGGSGPSVLLDMHLWRTRRLSLAGFSDRGEFLALSAQDHVRLLNRSSSALRDCTLSRRGVLFAVGDIPPGREVRLKPDSLSEPSTAWTGRPPGAVLPSRALSVYGDDMVAGAVGDCVVCGIEGSPPALISSDTALSFAGSTTVVFHLGRRTIPGESEAK